VRNRTNDRAILSRMSTTTPTKKGLTTRDLILDKAYELAREDGLESLSIGVLALSTGMSKSGVFAHFGSREQLQLALLEFVGTRFVQFIKTPAIREPRGLPRLRKLAERWCEWGRIHQSGCVLLSAAVEYDGRDGALRQAVLRQQSDWRDELRRAINLAIEAGHLRADTDPTQMAFEIYALMLGLHHDAGLFGYEEARQRTNVALERLFTDYQRSKRE
jgi:AcrR family transcriptional regulator